MENTDKTVRGTFTFRKGRKGLIVFTFAAVAVLASAVFLIWPGVSEQGSVSAGARQRVDSTRLQDMYNQVVRLGSARGYAVYGERGITATGDNSFSGAVGAGANAEISGVDGANRGSTEVDLSGVRSDLAGAFSALRQLPYSPIEDGSLNGKTLGTGFYSVAANTLNGELVFDGGDDSNAILALRVSGNFEITAGSRIRLINGAQAYNVHIIVDGDLSIGSGAELAGSVIARGNIDARQGSKVRGQLISVDGTVASRDAELGAGTGRLEICKAIAPNTTLPPQNFVFTFAAVGGGTQQVSIPAGVCSAPREVPSGTVAVTESYNGTFAVSGASAVRVGGVNVTGVTFTSSTGVVNVPVLEGDLNNETTLTVVNQPVRAGFVEICKSASAITAPISTPEGGPQQLAVDPVTGVFEFTYFSFPNAGPTSVFVPVGGCSLPQQITSFTGSTTAAEFPATITEVGKAGVLLERVTTDPADRLVTFSGGTIGAGGTATVRVLAGDAGLQAIVTFFNRSAPGEIKVCKVAGPGVPVGTLFTFDVSGTGPGGTLTAPTFPGTLFTRAITVQAGPGPDGFCGFVRNAAGTANQTFVVGTRVTVTERPLTVSGAATAVTRIDQANGLNITENLPARTTSWDVLPGTGVTTFWNIRNSPTSLKVCKLGTGAAANGTFTFDLLPAANQAGNFEAGFTFGIVSVAAGSCSQPIAGFPSDVNILVDERAATGVVNTGATCQAGTCSIISTLPAQGQATIDINTGITVNEVTFTNASAPPPVGGARATDFDFDGDGKADPSIFRGTTGAWWVLGSRDGSRATVFGAQNDIIVPADYDGDAKADYAVYRGGQWHVLGSSTGYSVTTFGLPGDIPQAGDYDNDGKADFAVYRPSTGIWYMLRSREGFGAVAFGISTDLPVAADYDGDGSFDPAVFRGGIWHILGSRTGYTSFQFGFGTDRPVQADYDGDGRADAAVYRDGTWYMLRSTAGFSAVIFGIATDKPVPADYDGDHKADLAVFRPSDGVWHVTRSSMTEAGAAYTSFAFGISTDTPIPH